MSSYVFEFSKQNGDQEWRECFDARVFDDDKSAIRSARMMFYHRQRDKNDELHVYQGRRNGWGNAEGRYVGKVAWRPTGGSWTFYPGAAS